MAGQPGRSGGPRTGKPGKAYPSRIDLHKPTVAPSQEYGQAAAQQRAMNVVPLPAQDLEHDVPPVVPLTAATQRPDEPVTTGLPFGPGAGPEAVPGFGQQPSDPVAWLKAIYTVAPSNDLLDIIQHLQEF